MAVSLIQDKIRRGSPSRWPNAEIGGSRRKPRRAVDWCASAGVATFLSSRRISIGQLLVSFINEDSDPTTWIEASFVFKPATEKPDTVRRQTREGRTKKRERACLFDCWVSPEYAGKSELLSGSPKMIEATQRCSKSTIWGPGLQ